MSGLLSLKLLLHTTISFSLRRTILIIAYKLYAIHGVQSYNKTEAKHIMAEAKVNHDTQVYRIKGGSEVPPTPSPMIFERVDERTCQANQAGENSSFIFTVCVKSVPRYSFKFAYVVPQIAVKEFLENHL